jgi:hypothetical protein
MCQRRRVIQGGGARGLPWLPAPLTFNESECRHDERGSARVETETAVVRGQHGAAAYEKEKEGYGYSLFFDPLLPQGFWPILECSGTPSPSFQSIWKMVYTIKFRKDIFVCVQKHLPCVGDGEAEILLWGVEYFWVLCVFSGGGRTLTETVGIPCLFQNSK